MDNDLDVVTEELFDEEEEHEVRLQVFDLSEAGAHAMAMVKLNGTDLQYIPETMRTKELCMEAVKSNGFALKYVPNKHRSRELFLAAVCKCGMSLKLVPARRRQLDICIAALKDCPAAMEFVPRPLKSLLSKSNLQCLPLSV